MFSFGKNEKKSIEMQEIAWKIPAVFFSAELALTSPIFSPLNTAWVASADLTFSAVKIEYEVLEYNEWNCSAYFALSRDSFPTLEKYGLIPKKPMLDIMQNNHWKANNQFFERMIIESDLQYYRIPYSNEDILALQKRRREKEYEDQARSTMAVTINFLLQFNNKLIQRIDWNKNADERNGKFLPKLPRLPLDIVKIIASYFSFEVLIIKKLEALTDKTTIVTLSPMKSIFFKSVGREKSKEDPLSILGKKSVAHHTPSITD